MSEIPRSLYAVRAVGAMAKAVQCTWAETFGVRVRVLFCDVTLRYNEVIVILSNVVVL